MEGQHPNERGTNLEDSVVVEMGDWFHAEGIIKLYNTLSVMKTRFVTVREGS